MYDDYAGYGDDMIVYNIVGIIIAAVIAIIIGKDASERGMSGVGWGIFTFLICIISVPIYLVVRKPKV
ncbi:MAG: hypothetical protein QOC65_256 [Sphingomonadales bacterium]|nr:hypothetical protein [Sphingomonadales bacterium]